MRGCWQKVQEEGVKPSCDSGPGSLQPRLERRGSLGRRRYEVGGVGCAAKRAPLWPASRAPDLSLLMGLNLKLPGTALPPPRCARTFL